MGAALLALGLLFDIKAFQFGWVSFNVILSNMFSFPLSVAQSAVFMQELIH